MLCAGEEADEVAKGASGMGVVRIGEVGDRASEGQAAGISLWQGKELGVRHEK